MHAAATSNRSMFWRIVRRLVFANRGRLFVILLALSAGAAVSSALLNLQIDAKRRLTTEFRSFGPNILITPHSTHDASRYLDESLFDRIPTNVNSSAIAKSEFLYGVVEVAAGKSGAREANIKTSAVIVGYNSCCLPGQERQVLPIVLADVEQKYSGLNSMRYYVGNRLASKLKLDRETELTLANNFVLPAYSLVALDTTGGPEDDQLFLDLLTVQKILNPPQKINQIQVSVPGTPAQVLEFSNSLQSHLGDAEVRPLRQFTEAQAKIYSHISGLLTATVAIILVLTTLCVMAAMTNIAAERKPDVGMMKAIGGSARRILRLFLMEAFILGLLAGLIGATAGFAISAVLGKAVFGLAARPRLIVYPIAVSLTVIVAILGAYPLRRLAQIRPASIFRGEA